MAASDARYGVSCTDSIVRLADSGSNTVVSIAPHAGNLAFEMRIGDRNVLWFPFDSVDEFRALGHGRAGIPFLAPWANRLDEQAFYANGRRFAFDVDLGNIRGEIPIHGLLMETDRWQVVDTGADGASAWTTSRLDFFRQPLWMKQFPFAHTIEMTHRLREGTLEITTSLDNVSAEPMPVAIGFHPYFQLPDANRDDWMVSIGARRRWRLGPAKLPTGETDAIDAVFPNPGAIRVRDHTIDDVFDDLLRDESGSAVMRVSSAHQRIDVELGPKFRAAVVYAPELAALRAGGMTRPGAFVCLEPMAGITNSMNLAHRGVYGDLQYIPAGGAWRESFRIRPSGF